VDAVGNNNGCITRCKLIWTSWRCVFLNVMKISRVSSKPLADCAVSLATLGWHGWEPWHRKLRRRTEPVPQSEVRNEESDQCVVTPLALSQGCGLIASYTSPYLTPAG
jgi:hypothetical protein